MVNKSNFNDNDDQSSGGNSGSESQPEATSAPPNAVTPGNDGRTWRGDSADFSEDTSNVTKFSRDE